MPAMKRGRAEAEQQDLFEDVLGSGDEQQQSENDSAREAEEEEEEEEEPEASTSTAAHRDEQQPPKGEKVLDLDKLAKFNKKIDNTGVIYISRIPPGMGPSKLKHLLSKFGDTNRVYLARDPKDTRKSNSKKGKEKHQAHRFVEGWIEFTDKKKARRTAEFLNASRIGGKKSDPYYDDIWTLKYLPKFKWSDLSASVAHQRAMDAALLRNEISQSKKAQASYLDNVDKARLLEKRKEKQQDRGKEVSKPKTERNFKQRSTVGAGVGGDGDEEDGQKQKKRKKAAPASKEDAGELQNVMDNLFG